MKNGEEDVGCVKLQDGVDALAGLLVLELHHHHFGHSVGNRRRGFGGGQRNREEEVKHS